MESSEENKISRGLGWGYIKKDGTICMEVCFHCGLHNYSPAVSSGFCWTCKFTAGKCEPAILRSKMVEELISIFAYKSGAALICVKSYSLAAEMMGLELMRLAGLTDKILEAEFNSRTIINKQDSTK